MGILEPTVLQWLIDKLLYVVAAVAGFVTLRQFKQDKKLSDHDTMIALLQQSCESSDKQRTEDMARIDKRLDEVNERLSSHHTVVMNRLDGLFGKKGSD